MRFSFILWVISFVFIFWEYLEVIIYSGSFRNVYLVTEFKKKINQHLLFNENVGDTKKTALGQ